MTQEEFRRMAMTIVATLLTSAAWTDATAASQELEFNSFLTEYPGAARLAKMDGYGCL